VVLEGVNKNDQNNGLFQLFFFIILENLQTFSVTISKLRKYTGCPEKKVFYCDIN